ncbi:MAG: FtsB family cell division protein [Eubacteriaceae bacterium]
MRRKNKKKVKKGTLLILVAILGYFLYNYISVEIQYYNLVKQKQNLEIELVQEQNNGEQLDDELEQIDSDKYIEILARKYFGLVYPQEKVIIEVESDKK